MNPKVKVNFPDLRLEATVTVNTVQRYRGALCTSSVITPGKQLIDSFINNLIVV